MNTTIHPNLLNMNHPTENRQNTNWITENEIQQKYQIVWTQDSSPTLKDIQGRNQESMHHSGGAYTETQFIYGTTIRQSLEQNIPEWTTMIVGLGMGYIEWLWACEIVKKYGDNLDNLISKKFQLHSFESDPFLVKLFLQQLNTETQTLKPLNIFKSLFSKYETDYPGLLSTAKNFLVLSLQKKHFQIFGPIEKDFPLNSPIWPEFKNKYHTFCYDAFSSKTSPHLWDQEFLTIFFNSLSSDSAFVSTYACTGNLKRALKSNHFELDLKNGFSGKRQCTFARKWTHEKVY